MGQTRCFWMLYSDAWERATRAGTSPASSATSWTRQATNQPRQSRLNPGSPRHIPSTGRDPGTSDPARPGTPAGHRAIAGNRPILATAAPGAGAGSAGITADTILNVPTSTPKGTYTATLTLTAI